MLTDENRVTAIGAEIPTSILETARRQYQQDGYCALPSLLPADLIARIPAQMQEVLSEHYETGVTPLWMTAKDPTKLRIVDQAHTANRTVYQLISSPIIGQVVAAVTGARKVQVWAASLIHKPPGGSKDGRVGFHQDWQYFDTIWEVGSEEIITAWVAISDVTVDAGPVRYVPGSHRWGLLKQGDLFNPDHDAVSPPNGETWREVPATLPPGGFSIHHGLTFHGSGPNTSAGPRLGFALHLCTDKAVTRPLTPENPGLEYIKHLGDPSVCPVLYEAT